MFTTPLDVRADTEDDEWILLCDLVWKTDTEQYTVPKNFKTDLASIPRGLRWLLKQNGKSRRPGCLHDFLYRNGILERKACDDLFLIALTSEGMIRIGRWLYYAGVRLGGAIPYFEKE